MLKGKGMPQLRGRGRGDLFYEVVVEVPTKLTARQKELLEEFRQISEDEAGSRASKFVERMKKLFGS
jgi:molecular chaperone DnaJ